MTTKLIRQGQGQEQQYRQRQHFAVSGVTYLRSEFEESRIAKLRDYVLA